MKKAEFDRQYAEALKRHGEALKRHALIAFRASRASFPLDANSRAMLEHLSSAFDFDFEIAPDDICIHIYRIPGDLGLAFIFEGPRGFANFWGQGGGRLPSLAKAEADFLGQLE